MKIMIHGGFFSESTQSEEIKRLKQDALGEIIQKSYHFLLSNTALDTVVYAVQLLEDHPLFNAGIGSQLQKDGKIRMSAALMDGKSKKFSGVLNIESIQNPIHVARALQMVDDRVLGGEGAINFAKNMGKEIVDVEIPERRKEYENRVKSAGIGTVGCVALDNKGHLAAATSTGGKGFELPGRISDSATVAGNYANDFCAISCTGVGEDIVSGALAAKIVTRVTDGLSIKDSFAKSFQELKEFDGFAGAIGLDALGNMYYQESYPKIVYASFDGAKLCVFS
jgi:L-asparaginase